jgi:DNA-directed RNA polymerase subunit K/omega
MNADMSHNKILLVMIITQRAKQIQKGASLRLKSSSTRPTRIAREEVEQGLIDFAFITPNLESERNKRVDLEQVGAILTDSNP